jgi:chaperone modulatory protein CbpM
MSGLSVAELQELVEYGLLTPAGGSASEPLFHAGCVPSLRRASALRARFDLDLFVLGLMFSQLEHIELLEQQLRTLRAHVPHPGPPREGPSSWREPHG